MTVVPLVPDVAPQPLPTQSPDNAGFARALDDIGATLEGAQHAEDAFAAGSGNLAKAVYERAKADVTLAVAAAAAQRAAQALQTVLSLQV